MHNLLIIERDSEWRRYIGQALEALYSLRFLENERYLGQEIETRHYKAIIFDLESISNDVMDQLRWLTSIVPYTSVIVTSHHEQADLVVKTIKYGAFDFVTKPFSTAKIRHRVKQAIETLSLKDEIAYLRREQDIVYNFDGIIAESLIMNQAIERLKKFSQVDSTILMTGETGTGKSFLAGTIHFNSQRQKKPFIHVNCANISETLLESELFGHEKGSFTGAHKQRIGRFEQAHGGTLFLDEIGELSLPLQAKLLRVLEEKSFERVGGNKTIYSDARIIAATNRQLEKLVANGEFRSDLYYRINILHINLPPLRKRKECIRPLSQRLLEKYCRILKKRDKRFSKDVMEWIQAYEWPGNIRELANCIERAVILEESSVINWESFALPNSIDPQISYHEEEEQPDSTSPETLMVNEKDLIAKALQKTNWVQKDAAKMLGISARSLNYKIKKYQITHSRWRKNKGN